MMENAGRALAGQARRLLGGDVHGRRVAVLAGRGGNGGGGLAAARRLFIWGADVSVVLAQAREALRGVPLRQLTSLDRLGVPVVAVDGAAQPSASAAAVDATLRAAEVVLDALIGCSLQGPPREPIAALIRAANAATATSLGGILARDLPSGLGGDSGEPSDPTIHATATLTPALPKAGLLRPAARPWVGELYLADISVPEAVHRRLGLRVGPLFARDDVVRVARDA
jgi:NAD(P)H-hydrate epimerase